MISDEDLATGWEGPIWISKEDQRKMPNFEYIPTNEPGNSEFIDILMNTRHGLRFYFFNKESFSCCFFIKRSDTLG